MKETLPLRLRSGLRGWELPVEEGDVERCAIFKWQLLERSSRCQPWKISPTLIQAK
jgi:hypothetical protein